MLPKLQFPAYGHPFFSSKLGFSTKFCPCVFTNTKMHPMSKVVLLIDES